MNFLKLKCLEEKKESKLNHYGSFVLGPLMSGQGITVGNSIRRTLLSNIPGVAITSVQIVGAEHEYSTLPGVRESVLEILSNLKQIIFTTTLDFTTFKVGFIHAVGPGSVFAQDLQLPSFVEPVDKNQYIATLESDGELHIKFTLEQDEGYRTQSLPIYKIPVELPIDAVFMPIRQVNYKIQTEKVYSSYQEYIYVEIWTNGSISPHQALQESASKLQNLFEQLRTVPVPENKLLGEWSYAIRRDLVHNYPL